jgi:hypothetical protein
MPLKYEAEDKNSIVCEFFDFDRFEFGIGEKRLRHHVVIQTEPA